MKNRKNIKRCLITSVLIGGLAVLPAGNQIVGDYGQFADEIQQVQRQLPIRIYWPGGGAFIRNFVSKIPKMTRIVSHGFISGSGRNCGQECKVATA